MIYKPLIGPEFGVYWHVLQTYSAAGIAFDRFCKEIWDNQRDLLLRKPNESDLFVEYVNKSTVFWKSGDNFNNLRTETLNGVILDELRQQHPHLWSQVILPMLMRYDAWCDIYTTPNGFDHCYDLYQSAQNDPENWGVIHAPSTEAWWWTPKRIQFAKDNMSEAEFAQEILAEFRDLASGKTYTSFGEWNNRTQNPFDITRDYSQHIPLYMFCDFNLAPGFWALGQSHNKHIHITEEIYMERTTTPYDLSNELIARVMRIGKDYVNKTGGVHIIGDATGKATQRTSHKSDYDMLCMALDQAGIRWSNQTPESNPPIKDRVNSVNAALKSAYGTNFLTFNFAKCPQLVKDFQRVVWKQTEHPALDPGPENKLTHGSDAVGYGVCVICPLGLNNIVGVPRVITR